MKGVVAGSRSNDDRAIVADTENLAAHVDLAHIDEPARPQLKLQETFSIGAQRHLVVEACSHVSKVGWRHVLLHHRLEVEYVDGLLRIGDQTLQVPRARGRRRTALGVGP